MARKKRGRRADATDLSDTQWALLAPLIPEPTDPLVRDPLTGLHRLFASRPQPCDFKASCSPSHVRKERTVLSKTTWPKGPEKGTAAPGVGA